MGLLDQPPFPGDIYKSTFPREEYEVVSREEWGALPPTSVEPLPTPVGDILFSYTETDTCNTKEECIELLQRLQKEHMDQGMTDIRYSFLIGGDTRVYECRGWTNKAGPHFRFPFIPDHAEITYAGQKGDFPPLNMSYRAWQWIEDNEWKGIVDRYVKYEDDWHHPFDRTEVDELT